MHGSLIFIIFIGVAIGDESVKIRNNISVGDEFVYAENQTTTTVEFSSGETNVKLVETICNYRIVELDYDGTDLKGNVEKFCTWARFTPTNDREKRDLLLDHSRIDLRQIIHPPGCTEMGEHGSGDIARFGALFSEVKGYQFVSRLYNNEEYETEVVTFEIDAPFTLDIFGIEIPGYSYYKREVDTNTGATVLLEATSYTRRLSNRETQVSIKKLIKPKTVHQDL